MYNIVLMGRPNVGKSRLFNRMVGKKISIVHDQAGVTRDIVAAEMGNHFLFMDTGGIGLQSVTTPQSIQTAIEEQVSLAIQAADLILFVVDGQEGLTLLDEEITAKLRSYNKDIFLVVNKIDTHSHESKAQEFYHLGFSNVFFVSAEHDRGMSPLWEKIEERFGPIPQSDALPQAQRIRICFSGRPNVGKSSLINALLSNNRLVVSDVPGTTRDAVEIPFDYSLKEGEPVHFTLVDTAGVRPKPDSPVEYFSALRTEGAVEKANVVLLVLDARDGVTKQDKRLAGKILESGKALIIVVNKWDLATRGINEERIHGYDSIKQFQEAFLKALKKELFFLPNSPIVFVSALRGKGLHSLLSEAQQLSIKLEQKIATPKVNQLIADLMKKNPPSVTDGKRFKIYYALQVSNHPFIFRVFCNHTLALKDSYRRYLEKGFYEALPLGGCPIRFEWVGKPARETK